VAASLHNPFLAGRFYAILDPSYVSVKRLAGLARAVLTGGADIVQLRAKNATTSQRVDWLRTLVPICAGAGAPLICNDDIEAALAVSGVGLHVGQDDLSPRAARTALGPERALGLSTHSLAQARTALELGEVLTYFAVGPVFPTATKPDYPAVGLELVRAVAALNPARPWFCIGGINRQNVTQVRAAGGRAVVAVSEVLRAVDPVATVCELRAAME